MNDESTYPESVCWFCQKGRHAECMGKIPLGGKEGDCSFNTIFELCLCCGVKDE